MEQQFTGLEDERLARVLEDVHRASKGDRWLFARALPAGFLSLLRGRSVMEGVQPYLARAFIGVPREVGELLYLTARARGARRVVEFGTSFGISALYLAAAMRRNGGRFIGTELEPSKVRVARDNLEQAGLTPWAEVREGDALQTLASIGEPIDLVLLDGWKDLYLPVLELLTPHLAPGAVIFADNIHTFRKALAPYVVHMRAPANGFESTTLPLGSGVEMSVFRP